MAGTCTVSPSSGTIGANASNKGEIPAIVWDWVSSAAGEVSSVAAQTGITGRIEMVRFIPGADTETPTDGHNVYLLDEYGFDVLMACGVGQSNNRTNTETIRTPLNTDNSYLYLQNATLTPYVTGAGDSNTGKIILVVR